MTPDPGTYALFLRADAEQAAEVGALGVVTVEPGTYVYVGSAFGPGGLRARVARHVRGDGALHWHVDSLRAVTMPGAVWYTHDAERRECTWAAVLRSLPDADSPFDGFGASDCSCPTHLVRVGPAPSLSVFRARLYERCPDHAPVERIGADAFE